MSEVLDFIRKQEPRFRQVSDEDLTRFVGEALPEFLQDPDFKTQYDTLLNPPSLRPGRVENAPSRISRSDVENLIALTNPDQADSLIEVARKPLSQHLKEVAHDLMTPLVSLPRLESGELQTLGVPETPAKVLAGAQRGVINATEFFLSPLGIATLGIGGLPSAAQRAIAGAFAVDMARQTPEIFAQLGEAVGTEDLERATELTVTGAANTLFAGKSAAHALGVGRLPLAGQIGKEMLRYIRSPEMDAALRSQVDASARQALDQGVRVEVIREADSAERARLRAQGLDILEPGEVRPGTPAEVQTTEGIAIVRAPAMGEMPRYAGEFEGQPIERGERTPPAPPPAKPAAPQPVDMLRIPPKPPARVFEASTPGAQSKVSGVYDVVEARDLVTSFDPGYDAALQPRDRSRQASANQITTLAQRLEPQRLGESPTTDMGAPIVDERNQLLSGNGRTEALRMLYGSEGGAAPYKDYLVRNADRFGLTPEQVAGMNQPVLVRRVSDYGGLSKEEFARQSNQQQVLGMGEVEFAASDARLLAENPALRDSFAPGEDGNLLAATNRDFLNRFIQATGSQAELLTKEGYNAPAVIRRVKNAILAGLIGPENRTLISRMIEGAEELNIKISVNGLMTASPALFRLKGTAYDLSTLIEQAMKDQVALRHSGQKLEEFLSQANLFGEPGRSAASDQLLTFLAKARSVKQVSEALARYQRAAENAIADAQSGGMFGLRPATREELLQRIYERQTSPAQENLPTGKPPPTAGGAPGSGAEAPLADPVATERLREAPERKPLADPLQSPAPPGAPTAQLFDQRLPVTLTQTTQAAPVSVPEIMRSLEDVVRAAGGQAPIRTGRMGAHARTARGFFKPFQEVIRIKQADNIPTATHEVAHALQKELFGSSKSKALFGLPVGVKRELVALGQALYGSRKPAAGYTAEGWAEFVRHWLTTEDAPRLAPQTLKLFEAEILAKNPAVARALRLARDKIEVYRAQGAVERAKVQMVRSPGVVKRIERAIRDFFTARNHVDEFEPLYQISVGYRDITGKSLSSRSLLLGRAADPFLLATWKRGTAGTVVEAMVERGMQDIWGNPTGGGSLREALAPVRNRQEDFTLYIWARRAVERWSQGKNPGITREDAEWLVTRFDSPKFQLAAQKYYEWNAGVMEYLREANPAMGPLIDAIKAASKDYAPLARVIDPKEATAAAVAARANPLYRMKGSGRQVRDIWETTLENTARLVSLAHRNMILNSIVKLSKAEGMGYLVEQVPRDRVPEQFNFDLVRQQLEEMGVDTSLIDANTTLTYFTMATKPKGLDPIVAVKDMTEVKWYYVAPEVYEVLNGLQIPRLGPIADLFLGMPARAFRLGTTGLRASFSLVTNPLRDLRTFVAQTTSSANPAKLAASYFSSMEDVVRAGFGGRESEYVQAFHRLGAQIGQPLGIDIAHTRRAARELFYGKRLRVVRSPIEHLRELLSITESAPRLAELKLIADEIGWKPGRPMTPDQAVALAVAAKRVTVDFSAGGRISKWVNQAVPFYNASIQGTRSFARALRDHPTRAVLTGLTVITVPALLNWWRNKDEEWYQHLPWRERYLYDNIADDTGNVWQIPRPFEWGNLFAVLPEAMLDSWYRQDSRGATEALQHVFETTNPLDYPVLAKIAKEQWQNRIAFFDRPIVPRSQIDLPPGDQRGPYTTRLGEWIGDAFPNVASPRRIDAAVRSFFGGALPDLMDAIGLGSQKPDSEWEGSDFPVFGRLLRRGGEFSGANRAIADFYDEYLQLSARAQSPTNPLQANEQAYWSLLRDAHGNIREAQKIADKTKSIEARRRLFENAGREARRVLALKPK